MLLYALGSTDARMVVRGPKLLRLAIVALRLEAEPPQMVVEAQLQGRRYVENRDTAAVLAGDKDRETTFTERSTFALDGPPASPWRLVAGDAAPV